MPRVQEQPVSSSAPNVIVGKGEMADAVRAFDWSQTALGAIPQWPSSLVTAVNICLNSRFPMVLWWGRQLTLIYNDAWRPVLGASKHPRALGSPGHEIWPEIWSIIGSQLHSVLDTGEATWSDDLLLVMDRNFYTEEAYFTYSYSPILLDAGSIGGVFTAVSETTRRVIGERRLETLRLLGLNSAEAKTTEEAYGRSCEVLHANPFDIPFALVYAVDADGRSARLVNTVRIARGLASSPESVRLNDESSVWPLAEAIRTGAPVVVSDLVSRAGEMPGGNWPAAPVEAVIVPMTAPGHAQLAGLVVVGVSPYLKLDEDYRSFLDLAVGHVATAVSNVQAYESERKRAESLAALDRAKTTFFSNISHEFRTPLTLMLGPLEEAMSEAALGSANQERLSVAHRNCLRLLRLVNTLLDFSRIEEGRIQALYQPTDLARFTAEIASNFRSACQQAGLDLLVACADAGEPVYVDPEMWEKIVLNLISNAFKFTLKGSIGVELSLVNDMAELSVRDTGIGIPPEELPRLFERFHRVETSRGRTHEGTGIGLALVQELVKAHGGTVSAQSTVDQGSTFTVRIPLGVKPPLPGRVPLEAGEVSAPSRAEAYVREVLRWLPESETHAPANARDREAAVAEMDRPRVLLVEDNADMRDYVRRLLSPEMEVTVVADGEEALRVALSNPPDLVLSDVMMPVMDGFALLRELRSNSMTSTIPVLLLSARAGEDSRVEGAAAGADDYLVKPFSARELLARVNAHLRIARARKSALDTLRRTEEDLRRNQEELSRQVDEFETLFRELPVGVGVSRDRDCRDIRVNPAFGRLLGISTAENGSKSRTDEQPLPFRVLHEGREISADDLPMQLAARTAREVRDFEFDLLREDGTRIVEYGHAVPLFGPDGNVSGSLGVFLDITERKRAEEALGRANEELRRLNDDLNQFAYSASHDLQEPLRNVSIYSQILRQRLAGSDDPEIVDFLGVVIEGTNRMEALLRDLLAYTRITSFADREEQSDANAVLQTVLSSLKPAIDECGATIEASRLPKVAVSEVHLYQLLQNLVGNSLKYRDPRRPTRVRIDAQEQGSEWWQFAVQDNGIGIAPEYHERIFGLFKRLYSADQYSGTGIGLAIAQKIVTRYGGAIWVESQTDEGANFQFTLPRLSSHD